MLALPTVTVPDRAAPALAVTVIVTVPPPATVAGDVEIQSDVSLTVQVQSLRPFTATGVVPAPFPGLTDAGDRLAGAVGHGPGCDTGTLSPPIVTVPDRASPVLAVTVIVTVPPPATVAGDAESQSDVSLTAQVQSLRPFTCTGVVPASLPALTSVGDTLVGDVGHGAGWVTVTVWSMTSIVPVRSADVVFSATV